MEGFFGGEPSSGEDHFGGQFAGNRPGQPGQPDQPAGAGDEPDPDLAERERGGGVGDDQVAGDCDLTTAAHGVAVDRSDDWFGEVLPAGEAGESVLGYPHGFSLPGPDEVVPGGERGRAGAGEDGDPEVGVGEVGVEDLIELVVAGGVSAFRDSGRLMVTSRMWPFATDEDVVGVDSESDGAGRVELVHPVPGGGKPVSGGEGADVDGGADGLLAREQVEDYPVPWLVVARKRR